MARVARLSLANYQVANAGDYHVVVSNEVDTVKSDKVTLSAPPVITQLTESKTVGDGDSITLSVTALGTPPFSYQWSKGGVEISRGNRSDVGIRQGGSLGRRRLFCGGKQCFGPSEVGCHHVDRRTCQQRLFPSQ